jgi:hypothetical protein
MEAVSNKTPASAKSLLSRRRFIRRAAILSAIAIPGAAAATAAGHGLIAPGHEPAFAGVAGGRGIFVGDGRLFKAGDGDLVVPAQFATIIRSRPDVSSTETALDVLVWADLGKDGVWWESVRQEETAERGSMHRFDGFSTKWSFSRRLMSGPGAAEHISATRPLFGKATISIRRHLAMTSGPCIRMAVWTGEETGSLQSLPSALKASLARDDRLEAAVNSSLA